jgi:hypothetical protein
MLRHASRRATSLARDARAWKNMLALSAHARAHGGHAHAHGGEDGASSCCDGDVDREPRFTRTHEVVTRTHTHGEASMFAVGIAGRGFDLMGDCRRVEPVAQSGAMARRGETLVKAHWDGFSRSASDELYHATWANASGVREVKMPFDGRVVRFNVEALKNPYMNVRGPDTWLVEIAAASDSSNTLLDEDAYEAMCDQEEVDEMDAANASYP